VRHKMLILAGKVKFDSGNRGLGAGGRTGAVRGPFLGLLVLSAGLSFVTVSAVMGGLAVVGQSLWAGHSDGTVEHGGRADWAVQDDELPPPRGAIVEDETDEARPLRRNNAIGRLRGQFPGIANNFQMNQVMGGGQQRAISQRSSNGVTTTKVVEGDREITIEETPDGIFMAVAHSYGLEDLDQLREAHPELAAAMEAFPRSADGQEVQLRVQAVQRYEAINEEDLQDEHPEGYREYRRIKDLLAQGGGFRFGNQMNFGNMMELDGIELPVVPQMNLRQFRREIQEEMEELREQMKKMMQDFN